MKTLVGAAEPEDLPPSSSQVSLTHTSSTTSAILVWRQEMGFVCEKCKSGNHEECPGNTRCDCQHRGQK